MEGANNEPSPLAGDRKADEQSAVNFDTQYQDMLKQEQEKLEAEAKGRAAHEFDNVRKLGFATTKDIDERIQGIFGKFVSQMEEMKAENTKLREWVMRAKAQGLNSGRVDEQVAPKSAMSEWERPFMKELGRR